MAAAIGLTITEPGVPGDPLRATLPGAVLAGDFLNNVTSIVLSPAPGGKTSAVIHVSSVDVSLSSPPVTI